MTNTKDKNELVLGIVQFDIEWENPAENREVIADLLFAQKDSFDLFILPESFTTGFSVSKKAGHETMSGETVLWMKKLASDLKTALCGTLFITEDSKNYNRFVWVYPDGQISVYDKRHLFGLEGESDNFSRGKQQVVIPYKGWKIMPQVCYDLRFPVWSRNSMGYDLLVYSANWPASRQSVWKTLLKARAIENQCYVAGVNRTGKDGTGINYRGGSRVFGPKGEKLISAKDEESVSRIILDRFALHSFRKKFNTLNDSDRFSLFV